MRQIAIEAINFGTRHRGTAPKYSKRAVHPDSPEFGAAGAHPLMPRSGAHTTPLLRWDVESVWFANPNFTAAA